MLNEKEYASLADYMQAVGCSARNAATQIARATTAEKNAALLAIAEQLQQQTAALLAANQQDLAAATAKGCDAAFLDRLRLTPQTIAQMIAGVRQIAELADIVGSINQLAHRPSGIQVGKMRVPIGVIGIIYESRPNVTIDAAALCLKAGNACILRGGSEAQASNQAIYACIANGLAQVGFAPEIVQFITTVDRAAVGLLIQDEAHVDVIIPRGGKSLVQRISEDARVPVIKHLDGICHVYIDQHANPEYAIRVADNAKTQRYAPCNAMETLLIHQDVAAQILPALAMIYREKGVELRGCARTAEILPDVVCATEQDWQTEYLAPILSIKVVASLDEAITHIATYGSHHTDAIISDNWSVAHRFLREVDSASVMVNASTRFADGFEYGLGAEMGISTNKLHARGPVGLEGLTVEKWIVIGQGSIRI